MAGDVVVESAERVLVDGVELAGDLGLPADARGVVVFAHGSGSSRHSPRNRQVARAFQRAGYATLLLDLLTAEEAVTDQRTRQLRFDIPTLAGRLAGAVDWLAGRRDTGPLPISIFGASTGAAAALVTAADRPKRVWLVISRGGRPDLAGAALTQVIAPTLLIVGGADEEVLGLNRAAAARMGAEVDLQIVPGATHLFPEPGALEDVIDLATAALDRYLPRHGDRGRPPSTRSGGNQIADETRRRL
jgi:putative phosphoribosyl transferase